MSKIQQFGRRYETFDASNTEHRAIFHGVLKYRTWGRAPIRFWAGLDSSGSNSLMDQCIREIGKYYMENEFGSLVDDDPFETGMAIRTKVKPSIQK
jgi:hypothetical protein